MNSIGLLCNPFTFALSSWLRPCKLKRPLLLVLFIGLGAGCAPGLKLPGALTAASLVLAPCKENGEINCIANSTFAAGSPLKNVRAPNGALSYALPRGYFDGSSSAVTFNDENLVSSNILKGITIFGVTGSIDTCVSGGQTNCFSNATFPTQALTNSATTPGTVRAGKNFYAGGTLQTGTMPSIGALNLSSDFVSGYVTSVTGLATSQICSGSNLLGSGGTAACVTGTTSNPAGAANILSSYEAWNSSGTKMTGSMVNRGTLDASVSLQPGYYDGTVTNSPAAVKFAVGATVLGVPGSAPSPTSSSFVATGSLTQGRSLSQATLLDNGKVLITGGEDSNQNSLASALIFDPSANSGVGAFSATASMGTPRYGHTASLLPNGKVLIVGGISDNANSMGDLASAEIFDPSANAGVGGFTATGSMGSGSERRFHTATLLPNGKVWIAGGVSGSGPLVTPVTTKLYDPSSGTFSDGPDLATGRYGASASLLWPQLFPATALPVIGKVLLAGGTSSSLVVLTSAELYDPGTNTLSAAGTMNHGRAAHAANLLPNGKVLLSGGNDLSNDLAGAELYDPYSNSFSNTGLMTGARSWPTATLMTNGKLVVVGGNGADIYDPSTGVFTNFGTIQPGSNSFGALLPNGKFLIGGGKSGTTYTTSAVLFK